MQFLEQFKDKKIYFCGDTDLDGVSSYIVFLYYIADICNDFNYTLTSERDMSEFNESHAKKADIILFTDITPTVELYKHLTEDLHKQVILFDHHIGPRDELLAVVKDNYYFTTEKCGAKILLDTLTKGIRVKKVVYEFIERVDLYDRYVTESALWKDAKDLHNVMYGYVNWFAEEDNNTRYNKFINAQMQKLVSDKYFYLTSYEKELALKAEKKEKDNLNQALNNIQFRTDNSNNQYGYFECSSKLSIVAMTLLNKYPNIKYIIGHSTYQECAKNDPNGKVSLRCREDFDVSLIAQKHNGNGHKQSSGAKLSLEDFDKLRKGRMHLI